MSGNSTRAEFYAGRTVTKGSNGWSSQIKASRDEFEGQIEQSEQKVCTGTSPVRADTWDRSVSSSDRLGRRDLTPGTRPPPGNP